MFVKEEKRAQVTIFVIIGIVLVAAVVLFFVVRGTTTEVTEVPQTLAPPYNAFLTCLEEKTMQGIKILQSQGGYIELPNYEPGSSYMPFSSQLNFLGTPIPYWYYVSANNLQKEQMPTLEDMQDDLGNFVSAQISHCDFSYNYPEYQMNLGEPKANVKINNGEVSVSLDMDFSISRANENTVIKNHLINVESDLGKLYSSAVEVYTKEQETLFLENYTIDILNLYAPVSGVDLSCGPLIWDAEEVFDDLDSAIVANIPAIKNEGESNDYFYVDLDVSEKVRFLASSNWPSSFEVLPTEGRLLISEPIGNQPGLGLLGFCYVPYNFIYNIRYPVLVQVYSGEEIFQFPLAIVILQNQAREAVGGVATSETVLDFCEYKNTPVDVFVRDANSGIVGEAEISYECAGTTCYIGTTENGKLSADFPQCANGRVFASADGYVEGYEAYSTTESGQVQVTLDTLYTMNVELFLDNSFSEKEALVTFGSEEVYTSIYYPQTREIALSEGEYNVSVYVYEDSEITLEAQTYEQCVDVPKGGLAGLIGLTEEQCYSVDIPEQLVSRTLSGGGTTQVYLLDSTLRNANKVVINTQSLPKVDTLEQLQLNYILFDDAFVGVELE